MTEQVTKNQHFVPQFYLRRFTNGEGKLEVLDCERRKILPSRSTKSACSEDYFYSLNGDLDEASQIIENGFKPTEDALAKAYNEITRIFTNFEEITVDMKLAVSVFMSMLWLRGPYMRKQIKKTEADMIKWVTQMRYGSEHIHKDLDKLENELGRKLDKKERKELIEFAIKGEYTVETDNSGHLRMLEEIEGFRNLFFGKDWTVYISKSSKKFVTSDNPVIELFPEWAGKVFYGPDFLQRTHLFSVSPDILIVATEPKHDIGNKVKRKTLFDNDKDNLKILELNLNFPNWANKYVYANDKKSLQDLIEHDDSYKKQINDRFSLLISRIVRKWS